MSCILSPTTQNDLPVFLPEYFDTTQLLDMLSKIKIPLCSNRSGRAKSFGTHRSMVLGFIKGRVSRIYDLSSNSKRFPEIYDAVKKLGEAICPFEFSSIQLNHNVQCSRHIDPHNAGVSCIISIGNYEGGDLHIEGHGKYNTRNHPLVFNGSKLYHWNDPITSGDKYSFVFFSTNSK